MSIWRLIRGAKLPESGQVFVYTDHITAALGEEYGIASRPTGNVENWGSLAGRSDVICKAPQ
jgi:hypothetical protein